MSVAVKIDPSGNLQSWRRCSCR